MKTVKILSNHYKNDDGELVWFESAKVETKNNEIMAGVYTTFKSYDDLNKKAKEMNNHGKETIDMQDKLMNPMAVEDTTEGIERYLGGFLFSHVGME